MTDIRRWPLAGYLSAEREYADRHPESLLPLADRILAYLNELAPDEADDLEAAP